MRLYHIDDNYFESIDELLHYCRINNKSTKGLKILDYYRKFGGCSDVIRNQDCNTIMFYTAVDEDGYGMTDDQEITIYGFIDRRGNVLIKFHAINKYKELDADRKEAERIVREKEQ